ncbi:TPA: hypothetical protein HA265_07275 [Candidatus Woesearchaeota archaeon]|nr:hypothetical protein [Candidatus Woesearchaeota archaeon]
MAFEIISEAPIKTFKTVEKAVWDSALSYLGELGCSQAGIMIIEDKYSLQRQRGLIKVNHKSLDRLRATLAMISQIEGQDVVVRSIGASGIIGKAEDKYIAG